MTSSPTPALAAKAQGFTLIEAAIAALVMTAFMLGAMQMVRNNKIAPDPIQAQRHQGRPRSLIACNPCCDGPIHPDDDLLHPSAVTA
jgi:hypothetical protein